MNAIRIKRYLSPVGELLVGSFDGKLCICDWAREKRRDVNDRRIQRALRAVYEDGASDTIERAIAQLDEYFARERTSFDISLIFTGRISKTRCGGNCRISPTAKPFPTANWRASWGVPKPCAQ